MTNDELNHLVLELQRTTQLGRLNHAEAHAVFKRIAELGYHGLTAPSRPISERADTP